MSLFCVHLAGSASLACSPGGQSRSNYLLPGCGKCFPGNPTSISLLKHKGSADSLNGGVPAKFQAPPRLPPAPHASQSQTSIFLKTLHPVSRVHWLVFVTLTPA